MEELTEHPDFVEDCDCRKCAIEYRNRYRKALEGISDEMGLPATMGPAKGALKRLLDNGKTAIEKLRLAPVATSAEADFEAMTWKFQIAPGCSVGCGAYALVWLGPNAIVSGLPRKGESE